MPLFVQVSSEKPPRLFHALMATSPTEHACPHGDFVSLSRD